MQILTEMNVLNMMRFFEISKRIVIKFNSWWRCENGFATPEECANVEDLTATELEKILEWPAHGDNVNLGQDFYLAPFYDNPDAPSGANGIYNPINDGDYPWYDINDEVDCRNDRRVTLFGDETHWWVFNDKGGDAHTVSQGEPIGMEIRAQAFAFSTNDEVNDMTFYNYELINRGTQTLFETYFAQYVDPDLGGADDDYVGCDVGRGLGFCYNGDPIDDQGSNPVKWGANPPAIGIDFFEGPYRDPDNVAYPGLPIGDNPLTASTPAGAAEAFQYGGVPYEGLGIGYSDGIPDNERLGMTRFIYYNNTASGVQGDPDTAPEFYGYMQGFWGTSGSPHVYGNDGLDGTIPANYMFPGDSDPAGWGTAATGQGADVAANGNWSELTVTNNTPADRRFVQVAGPFTLKPGAVNNLTVGVVFGRSFDGGLLSSVNAMKVADTKAQNLFDACFEILEPPLAPVVTIQELENELILLLDGSTDGAENYIKEDETNIPTAGPDGTPYDRFYRFQGYQIFQMVDEKVSIKDIFDDTKARLVAQCDIEDGVTKLINYEYIEEHDFSEPKVKVDGEDKGIKHSFRVTKDLFALGDRTLVNHKKYYYIAVSYAYNQFLEYNPNVASGILGQKTPYLVSRQSSAFGEIGTTTAIPHAPEVEADGTTFGTHYGWSPVIKQIEGIGNGGRELALTDESIKTILEKGSIEIPEYASGFGPIDVKVIDPLSVQAGDYEVRFDKTADEKRGGMDKETNWEITRTYNGVAETISSKNTIGISNEQLIPQWGISVTIKQIEYGGGLSSNSWTSSPISASIVFGDSSKVWLTGVADSDINFSTNWIRSGTNVAPDTDDPACAPALWVRNPCYYYDRSPITDSDQEWEKLLGGTITGYRYLGYEVYGMPMGAPGDNPTTPNIEGYFSNGLTTSFTSFKEVIMHDVDIVMTSDKTKWTKCVVIEMNNNENQTVGGSDVLEVRNQASVDKEGNPIVGETGRGWFPGYAINVNTGERLNMVFGENSWLSGDNGNDMIWNPTSSTSSTTGEPLLGGMHYVYVFNAVNDMPIYDEGKYIFDNLSLQTNNGHKAVFKSCTWVAEPLLAVGQEVLSTDVYIKARVEKPYAEREETKASNQGRPKYGFKITEEDMVRTSVTTQLESKLDIINIVPNPYYAYSEYEVSRIDNNVKITNLPERCNIKIFNMQGSLVRQFQKDDPLTSLDWDLRNNKSIPISSGVYIIYIDVPGVGEKVLKWFGTMRQVDLNNI